MEMPHFLASQTYSDVQFQMLHITHPSKQQEFFEMFRKLKHNEIFTDISFVTKGQRILKIHRLVLASFSSFMKDLFQETTVPDMNYTLILPDVEYSDVEALCHILVRSIRYIFFCQITTFIKAHVAFVFGFRPYNC